MKSWRSKIEWMLVVSLFLSIGAVPGVVSAAYPEKVINWIIPWSAGGRTDVAARIFAPALEKQLGKPVIVVNKPGAGGVVGSKEAAQAKPDGYTLFGGQNVSIVDTPLMQKVPFKPLASFTPIAVFAASEHSALLVKSDSPWKTFKEFMDYAKKNPGKIKYSSAGVGSGMHVAMETIAGAAAGEHDSSAAVVV